MMNIGLEEQKGYLANNDLMVWFANSEILSSCASRTATRFRMIKYLENNVNLPE